MSYVSVNWSNLLRIRNFPLEDRLALHESVRNERTHAIIRGDVVQRDHCNAMLAQLRATMTVDDMRTVRLNRDAGIADLDSRIQAGLIPFIPASFPIANDYG